MIDLFKYYGFDWLALLFAIIGIWQVGNKNRNGFIFYMIAATSGLIFAIIANSLAYIIVNIITLTLQLRAFIKWGKDNN